MRRTNRILLDVMIVVVLFSLLYLGLRAEAEAKSIVPIEGPKFDVSVSMKDNLNLFSGKDVFVHLRSGKTLQGYVKAVGIILSIWKNWRVEIFMMPSSALKISALWRPNSGT